MQNWTLVFDLDGTLVDTAPDLAVATNHVMKRLGLNDVLETDIRPYVGHGALAMIEGAAKAQGRVLKRKELADLFEVFIAYYSANIAVHSKPYAGVLTALTHCRNEGAILAVCTNKIEAHARALLDQLNMTGYFAAIAGRDSFHVFKPDPGHLTGTVALASGLTTKSIMIGDSETDVRTAKAANIPIVAVDFGYCAEPLDSLAPDLVISHYSDLPNAIRSIIGNHSSM